MLITVAVAQLGAALPSLIACECAPERPPCEAYAQSPMVFLGTVTDVVLDPDGHVGWAPSRARMRVDRAYKGVTESALTLYDDGMCDGPELEVGEQYLMYTRRDADGRIPTRGCTRSRHVKSAQEDLEYLEGLSDAPPTSRIYGRVASWPEGPGDQTPLSGATVTLVGPDELTTTADDGGQYSFDGLSPGKYSVSAEHLGFDMPLHDFGLLSADVAARGCAAIDVTLNKHWQGVIGGHLIRPDGTRASGGIDLNLLRWNGEEYRFVTPDAEVLTDEHGEYAFRSVRLGRYKIVLHWCCFPTRQAPYRAIYWPAAASEEGGSEILVGLEPDAKQYDFQLPTEVRSRTVSGLVLSPDGKPAPGLELWLMVGDDKHDGYDVADQIRTDLEGRFSFIILEGNNYLVEVRLGEGDLRSEPVPVSFDDDRGPIVLHLEHRTAQQILDSEP